MALWTTQFALSAGDEHMRALEDRNKHLRQKLAALRLELTSAKSIKDKREKDLKAAYKKQKEAYEQMKQKGWSAEAELNGQLAVLEAKKESLIMTKEIMEQEYHDLDDIWKTNKDSLDAQLAFLQSNLKGMATEKANMRSVLRDAKHKLRHYLKECEGLLDAQKDLEHSIIEALSLARAFVVRKLATIVQDDVVLAELKDHYEKEVAVLSSRPGQTATGKCRTSDLVRSEQKTSPADLVTSTDRSKKAKEDSRPKSAVSFTTVSNTSPRSKVLIEDLACEPAVPPAPLTLTPANARAEAEDQTPGDTDPLSTTLLIRNALEKDSSDYYRRLLNEDAIREFCLTSKEEQSSTSAGSYMKKLLRPSVQDCTESYPADKPTTSGPRAASSSKKAKRSSSLKRRAQQIKKHNKQYLDQMALIDILTEQRKTLQDKLINITNIRGGTYTKASTIMMIRKQIGELTTEIEGLIQTLPNISPVPKTT
ncbi:hypothetical protein GL50803_0011743 [Giardia duodenalis]|uniref:Uncharacterized protein n=1 Tax=Giardia intestinalis (strain ATCC 50803 / WB clone C6) TaxID=184922 RepID=A8B8V1_GIAIC|nr:hypothetical protein GL50803_0011743 [Giardia intestinalis]KAE8302385.1 hypothetical protein GL50803_0011743 [Giardia intestinalis]|eukprot:XP_001708696.1 Hypothetical protein GL50803_11743 [Giardia lamblia ATCC 50803]